MSEATHINDVKIRTSIVHRYVLHDKIYIQTMQFLLLQSYIFIHVHQINSHSNLQHSQNEEVFLLLYAKLAAARNL